MSNKAVSYAGPGKVEVIDTEYPEFVLKDGPGVNPANVGRKVDHGVILKTVATNICGSDQHMVRGRTTAPGGRVLRQAVSGAGGEVGRGAACVEVGGAGSVALNISGGRGGA
ncbi:formaldehyde dehydrogenase, glutathione-independent, partial [Mycobacterium tuberculosis]|nr:formaldehyde dehydrogenase, glutathione-independent [Mycobacterium tuberculosis]